MLVGCVYVIWLWLRDEAVARNRAELAECLGGGTFAQWVIVVFGGLGGVALWPLVLIIRLTDRPREGS